MSFLTYEIVFQDYSSWEYLKDIAYPDLTRYLKGKGMDSLSALGKDLIKKVLGVEYSSA
jgi:hypothetical protein